MVVVATAAAWRQARGWWPWPGGV